MKTVLALANKLTRIVLAPQLTEPANLNMGKAFSIN